MWDVISFAVAVGGLNLKQNMKSCVITTPAGGSARRILLERSEIFCGYMMTLKRSRSGSGSFSSFLIDVTMERDGPFFTWRSSSSIAVSWP